MHPQTQGCMSTQTFTCRHCHRRFKKNPRLKGEQHYCGSRDCQQARKNKWEREKLKSDAHYKARRLANRKQWYSRYPGDKYQSVYRQCHPEYLVGNREKQRNRGKILTGNASGSKIVNPDTLPSESLVSCGLYVLYPYKNADAEKIVNPDAFIVELRACSGFQDVRSCVSS